MGQRNLYAVLRKVFLAIPNDAVELLLVCYKIVDMLHSCTCSSKAWSILASGQNSSFWRYQDVTDAVLLLSTDNLVVEFPLE